jgi:Tfp pilus assembly protein PilX
MECLAAGSKTSMGRDVTVLRLIGMRSPKTDSGFILPVAIGVGLVMILLGIIIINRSMQNRFTAIAQKQTSQSQAAAEAGIAQLQSLFTNYRRLATYCSSTSAYSTCNGAITWQTLTSADLKNNSCSVVSSETMNLIQAHANTSAGNNWQNIGPNPEDGQFRLISYAYKPDNTASIPPQEPGTGELIVEGRVNGSDLSRTSTSRLSIQFKYTRRPGLAGPGLWIQSSSDTDASNSGVLKTNVRDSTCPANINNQLKSRQQSSYIYKSLPGEPFPSLLPEANIPPPGNSYALNQIQQLIENEETSNNGILAYRVQSIYLNDGSTMTIGSGSETIILYLDGGIDIRNHSKIKLASGSKLIIYAHGPILFSGDSTDKFIEQESSTPTPENVQIYVVPGDTPPTVNINGGADLMFFLFAQESHVSLGSGATVKGNIWAKSWTGSGSSIVEEGRTNMTELKLIFPPRISPITSWERVSNP